MMIAALFLQSRYSKQDAYDRLMLSGDPSNLFLVGTYQTCESKV